MENERQLSNSNVSMRLVPPGDRWLWDAHIVTNIFFPHFWLQQSGLQGNKIQPEASSLPKGHSIHQPVLLKLMDIPWLRESLDSTIGPGIPTPHTQLPPIETTEPKTQQP